jgi:hypothetical protein
MVLPRLPPIRPTAIVGGVIPVGPFSGGLLDVNAMLTSVLLVASAAIITWLRPARSRQLVLIFGLTPTAWMVVVMLLHGPGDIWPIALGFAVVYGALMAVVGVGLGKLVAWLSRAGRYGSR